MGDLRVEQTYSTNIREIYHQILSSQRRIGTRIEPHKAHVRTHKRERKHFFRTLCYLPIWSDIAPRIFLFTQPPKHYECLFDVFPRSTGIVRFCGSSFCHCARTCGAARH